MRYELRTGRISSGLVASVLLVVANAVAPVASGGELSPGEAITKPRASRGRVFAVKLVPRREGAASSGGLYQLAGSARVLIDPNLIFSDGFESGDTSAWSETVPPLGSMPSGAVVFFDATGCPSGWSLLAEARGRRVMGVPSAGTVRGFVGSPANNLGSNYHSHTVGGTYATARRTPHGHRWASLIQLWGEPQWKWVSYDVDYKLEVMINWSNGIDNSGSGYYPFAAATNTICETSSQDVHYHTLTLSGATSLAADSTPYVQLLACEKD